VAGFGSKPTNKAYPSADVVNGHAAQVLDAVEVNAVGGLRAARAQGGHVHDAFQVLLEGLKKRVRIPDFTAEKTKTLSKLFSKFLRFSKMIFREPRARGKLLMRCRDRSCVTEYVRPYVKQYHNTF